jgi:hypothetical protein
MRQRSWPSPRGWSGWSRPAVATGSRQGSTRARPGLPDCGKLGPGGDPAASRRTAGRPGLLAVHHRHPSPVAVTAHGACGRRLRRPVRPGPVRLPGQGQGDDRAHAAARGDPQAHRGQLGPEDKDQGAARPHGDRGADDDHAAQEPEHDPHPARSRPARHRRRFPGSPLWLAALLMAGPAPRPWDDRAGRPSGASPWAHEHPCRPPPHRAATSPSRRRAVPGAGLPGPASAVRPTPVRPV